VIDQVKVMIESIAGPVVMFRYLRQVGFAGMAGFDPNLGFGQYV